MENLDKELEKLRADMNKRIDEIKAKIEKPAFEVGKWNWLEFFNEGEKNRWLVFITEINSQGIIIGYGFNYLGNAYIVWSTSTSFLGNIKNITKQWIPTPQEVQAALKKEFNKLYTNNSKVKCLALKGTVVLGNGKFVYEPDTNRAFYNGVLVFDNGTWAEPIKTMSIDELADNLYRLTRREVEPYIINKKSQIIETLNNLENENR